MATSFEAIATVTVGSGGVTNFIFSNIPTDGTYTDLMVKASIRVSPSTQIEGIRIRFNSDGNLNYSDRTVYGNGSSAASILNNFGDDSSFTWNYVNSNSSTASTFGNLELYVANYASSNNKSAIIDSVTENNATYGTQWFNAGLWNQTTAISSINFIARSGLILEHSTATLYGIKNS